MTTALVQYDAMVRAIAQAYRVDEVKALRDKARALELYSRLAQNVENERRACEIRLRAERKAGQLLKVMAKSKERAPRGKPKTSPGVTITKLADLGITRNQSARWQKMADVPEDLFERSLAATGKPTTTTIVRDHRPEPKVVPVDPAALWLWGRLRDLERNCLNHDYSGPLATLTLKCRTTLPDWLPWWPHGFNDNSIMSTMMAAVNMGWLVAKQLTSSRPTRRRR